MTLLQRMDDNMHRNAKVLEVYVELGNGLTLGDFLREVRGRDITVAHTQRELDNEPEDGVRAFITTLKLQKRQNHTEVIDDLQTIPGVVYLEEL